MQALAVIEVLDILRDGIAGLGQILKLPMPHKFILQRTEGAFHRHIFVAITGADLGLTDTSKEGTIAPEEVRHGPADQSPKALTD
jgi:hypothetical protein